MHKPSQLLIAGFTSGIFALYEMPDFNPIHTLSISQQKISAVAVNSTGEWLAFGCSSLGQLLVWEWQSETYVLKQQSHFYDMNSLAYSPDGQIVATGGDDGKVKLWNTGTGFCFVTFSEHTAAVSTVVFSSTDKVVLSASLDGTVRAFDLHRYRNFRTFASPRPVQFSCLTLDPSGEVVCAGSHDTFEVYVWSMQTGRLLELLAGHEAPVSCLSFCPSRALLVSGSWDKSVRLWDVFESKAAAETLQLPADVLALTFRPDGVQLAVASLDAQITFWDIASSTQVGSIEGRPDLEIGRRTMDKVTAKTLSASVYFTCLCYTADGQHILAGGRSKFVCLYHVAQQILLKKFQVSRNLSFDGMQVIDF
jgi:periodic tryptophan protein 2